MNLTTEILIAVGIIGSMALQLGDHPATIRRLFAPVLIVAGFAVYYLKTIPTSGNDGLFTLAGAILGLALGLLAAALMGVRRDDAGRMILSAGLAYVVLWVAVFGARLAFALVATNSPETLRQLFVYADQHGITEAGWIAFFMVQAIVMVGARTAVVGARVLLSRRPSESPEAEAAAA
jgi:hypothetical protein